MRDRSLAAGRWLLADLFPGDLPKTIILHAFALNAYNSYVYLYYLYFWTYQKYCVSKMVIRQVTLFISIVLLYVTPVVVPRIIWLSRSQKTTGVFSFEGMGSAGEQIKLSYSFVYFMYGNQKIWFEGPGHMELKEGSIVPVRYQKNNPSDAKVDTFLGLWADTAVYCGEPLVMLILIFLHRGIFPPGSKIRLSLKKPFLLIIN